MAYLLYSHYGAIHKPQKISSWVELTTIDKSRGRAQTFGHGTTGRHGSVYYNNMSSRLDKILKCSQVVFKLTAYFYTVVVGATLCQNKSNLIYYVLETFEAAIEF